MKELAEMIACASFAAEWMIDQNSQIRSEAHRQDDDRLKVKLFDPRIRPALVEPHNTHSPNSVSRGRSGYGTTKGLYLWT